MEQTDSPTPSAAAVPALHTPNQAPATLDAHGHNPADYDWVPVLKKRRHDGWSPQRQRAFIEALADSGSVTYAARAVGMSRQACYELRRSPGAENFDRAWEVALRASSRQLIDIAFDRAINGVEEPLFDKEGQRIACRYRYNDRLLMFLIRAHAPEQYRHAHRDGRDAEEKLPAPPPPLSDMLRLLEPEPPAEPHLLMPPNELEDALFCADMLDGELPHWRRDRDPEAAARPTAMDAEIDRMLDDARRANSWDQGEPE
ncbi:MAG: hypothetical protein KA312_03775 [Sphingorhabdus sp.]|nr:hypothetical protein [Sphingorhabdus sp.]